MHLVILLLLVLALVFGPQLWAKSVLKRYSKQQEHFPGSGAEFARHLLNKADLAAVKVEKTTFGDHYDPTDRCVRLSEDNFNGKSLTAVTVAAHEVGHAIQHGDNDPKLMMRAKLVKIAQVTEKMGSLAMFAVPVLMGITRAPSVGALMFFIGLLSLGVSALVHLVTLPVEWDASFGKGKAMPLIHAGEYLSREEERGAKKILRACALTYFAVEFVEYLALDELFATLISRYFISLRRQKGFSDLYFHLIRIIISVHDTVWRGRWKAILLGSGA